ncbi:MAG: biopolymer transporter Tol [Ignavibacteria bacterium]|nr:biopolymer transporter Tol [Ignavibacteria bacterium]
MKHFKILKIFSFFLFVFILVINVTLESQEFGKNKVQYKNFKWKFIQSKHFDIYFYDNGYDIAEFTAIEAEKALEKLSNNLDYRISNRIPIILFLSSNDFQQNNVIDEYLPEGVGGVTELFKNRILIPFEGNYEQFRHVIHHELLHGFMNDMFYGGSIQNVIAKNITLSIPIWFAEGMAESQSLNGLDKETDMYIRDAIMNDYLPPIEYCDGYLAYRGGQSFFAFLMDYYGEHKIGELMNNIKSLNDVYEGFKETYKLELEKLSEKWHKELKKVYWSDAVNKEEVLDFAKMLTDHTKDGGFYNIAPSISPDGKMFLFISNRDDYFDVFLADATTGKIIDKVVEGNTTNNFEELQVLTPGLTWSPDSKKMAISVKAGESDAIFVIDLNTGDDEKLPISLPSITNASWSPKSNILAFTGNNGKQSDIYIYDFITKKITNLTNDIFSDENPVWSHDGKFIYFDSDRKDYINPSLLPKDFKIYSMNYNGRGIYRINTITKEIEKIIDNPDANEKYVQLSSDGKKMLYVSDINGIDNIYLREYTDEGTFKERPITNSVNPISQITLSKDGKKLLFVALNKLGYDIFSMDSPLERNIGLEKLEPTTYVKNKIKKEELTKLNDTTQKILSDTLKIDTSKITKVDNNIDKDTLVNQGNNIVIDFKKKKTNKKIVSDDSDYVNNLNFQIKDNINPDGSFRIGDYKIRFSPDLVYGNAGYSSFYGVQGNAIISLSDLMGNHRINILTSMVIDLKNSDYALSYYYLPKRLDIGFELYHTARFILYDRGYGDELFRYRNMGTSLLFSYPLTRFKRFDGGLHLMYVTQENLDDNEEPMNSNTFLVPSVRYVFDNSLWGYLAPEKGSRFNITFLGSPKLGSDGIEFASIIGDFRKYIKIADGFSLAMRLNLGASFGKNPQRFYLGGTENWINREFENYNIPISNIDEFAFSMPILPLRGYNYDRISGSKFALTNFEFRFPLFKYLILGVLPLGFQDIQGNLFIDAGTAWRDNKKLQLFTNDGGIKTKDLLLGMGYGLRIIFLGIPFKFDVAYSFDFKKFSEPKYYFSLGLDF